MKSNELELLNAVRKLTTDEEAQEQFIRTPVAFLGRVGISPEMARSLAPVLITALTTGIFLSIGDAPEWAPQWPPR